MLSDIVEQDQAIQILRKVVTGHNQSPLLLVGTEGTGRKLSVLETFREVILASGKSLDSPDMLQIDKGDHPDVMHIVAPANKELGVDQVRELLSRSSVRSISAPYRFFILEGVDRMTIAASNAVLKTLEDPLVLSVSRFFLLAESFGLVMPTIRSRCGKITFRKLSESFILSRLVGLGVEPDKALVYTRLSDGSIGRAVRYLGSNRLTLRNCVLDALHSGALGDLSSSFSVIDTLEKDLPLVLRFLVYLVHDILVFRVDDTRIINCDLKEDLAKMQKLVDRSMWIRLWEGFSYVWKQHESTHINLGFQVKSVLASVFVGG